MQKWIERLQTREGKTSNTIKNNNERGRSLPRIATGKVMSQRHLLDVQHIELLKW
jgi:hypothetical protein